MLAILGTGVQARSHVRVFSRVREWAEIRIAGRDPAKAKRSPPSSASSHAASFEDAVRGADVVAATTHSAEPVVLAEWVAPGTHVSSVGYDAPGSELDPALVARPTIVVESRESSFAPPPGGAPELAGLDRALVVGARRARRRATRRGRATPIEITLYKSVGVAVQDLAAAALVLAAARARNVGLEIELEEIPRMTEFSPGLAGVVAFETEIAEPDKEGGELRYRGVNIEDLVGKVPFEKVWGLLVDESLEPGPAGRVLRARAPHRRLHVRPPGGARRPQRQVEARPADRHRRRPGEGGPAPALRRGALDRRPVRARRGQAAGARGER